MTSPFVHLSPALACDCCTAPRDRAASLSLGRAIAYAPSWPGLLERGYARSASRRLRRALDRRIGIFAEPDQENTGQGKGDLIDREDLRIGLQPVEGVPAQRRAHAGADVEQHEHQAIDPAVGLEPEVTADEIGHEIDFGADAGAAQRRA